MEILSLLVPLALLALGYAVGSYREKRHLESLEVREKACSKVLVSSLRTLPKNWKTDEGAYVDGQAVIATDTFKTFAASLRNIFGGRVGTYETLMDRARREATLRMVEQARARRLNAVWNVRIQTSTIGRGAGRGGMPMAEVHVYGTAYRVEADS